MVIIKSPWGIRSPHGFWSKYGAVKVVLTILANRLKRNYNLELVVLVHANTLVVCDVKVPVTSRKNTSV